MVNALELLQNNIELFTLNGECLELLQNNMKSNLISVITFKPKILQIESVLVHVSVPETSLQIQRVQVWHQEIGCFRQTFLDAEGRGCGEYRMMKPNTNLLNIVSNIHFHLSYLLPEQYAINNTSFIHLFFQLIFIQEPIMHAALCQALGLQWRTKQVRFLLAQG